MANNIVRVLDTTVGEEGPTQIAEFSYLNEDIPLRFSASVASGDTLAIQGKAETGDNWETLHEFTDDSPIDVYVSHLWRAARTTDGGAGDSWVKVQNIFNQKFNTHS